MRTPFSAVIFLAVFSGCTRPSGTLQRELPVDIRTEFIRKSDGAGQTGTGRILQVNMISQTDSGVVLFDSKTMRHGFRVTLDGTSANNGGQFYRTVLQLIQNDSIVLRVPAQNLYDSTLKTTLPQGVAPTDSITLNIGIARAETIAENRTRRINEFDERKRALLAAQDSQTVADVTRIDAFLQKEEAVYQESATGLRYMLAAPGSGKAPAPGDRVTLHYRGTLLDGTLFDSSYDRDQPFTFQCGVGDVIFGFDEAVSLLREGGKGTFMIPSPLAYGKQERSEVIKANSILVFEIELLKVETPAQ
jgi:FKBP-type peptidyl-prolyl cis-trans isomerase